MGILNYLTFVLSMLFATTSCNGFRRRMELPADISHEDRHQLITQEDETHSNINTPSRIVPSRSWLGEVVLDNMETRSKAMKVETISWNGEKSQRNFQSQVVEYATERDRSLEMKDGSGEENANVQLLLIQDILFGKDKPKRYHRAKRSTSGGSPPKVNASIGNLNASYCSLFYFHIPENVFADEEDGNTRNLLLSLHFDNGAIVGSTSWLQLNSNLQTLYGFLKASDDTLSNSDNSFLYKLRATDSSGLIAETLFSIAKPSKPPEAYFQIELVVNNLENLERPDVNEVLFLAYRIFSFFHDLSYSSMNVLSFQRNYSKNDAADRIAITWTNCTISGKDCPAQQVNSLIDMVVLPDGTPNPSFTASLQPQYVIHELKAMKVGMCQEFSTSLQPTPTPLNSLSPIIKTAIPQLSVSTTTYFTYQIPFNIFYDPMDGYTRSLSLQLRTADNFTLTTSSWLQFETTTQTMFGILTSNVFSGSFTKYFSYMLIATNSRGYNTQMIITFKGSRQTVLFGALFFLQGRDNSPSSTYDVSILTAILQNLRKYLKDENTNTVEVKSFTRTTNGQQKVFSLAYFNTTITTGNCAGLDQLVPILKGESTLIHQDLTVALAPDIASDRIDITRYGNCSVYQTQSALPAPTPAGLFPIVQNGVPIINIKTGLFFRYGIPANSFYDSIDGDTTKLALQVFDVNGTELGRTSWMQFDAANQNLYGLLPANQQTIRPFQNFTFLLRVQNSKGNPISQVITIQSEFAAFSVGVAVRFTGRDYGGSQWNSIQLQHFMLSQLRSYLDIKSNTTILMLSFEQQATSSNQFSALWTDTRISSIECNQILLLNLELKIFSSKGIVHSNLISRMLPNVVVADAKISYIGQCSQNQTANSPVYATMLPTINVNTGLLFAFTIPSNTFMDNIDGDTRSISLSLSNIDGSALIADSRVQLNSSMQKVIGIYLDEDMNGASSRTFTYALRASNSRNLSTFVPLSILATQNLNFRGISVITMVSMQSSDPINTVQVSNDFLSALINYIQPSAITDFSIISLKQAPPNMQLVTITWSYDKVNVITCNRTEIDMFKALLNNNSDQLNPQFINAMAPTFNLLASETKTSYTCNDFSSSEIMSRASTNIVPTQSMSYISPVTSSITVSKNNPPSVTSKILPLFAYFCIPFSYTIPNDLFNDLEQGGTRNLQVHLENYKRQSVGKTSWLQFSRQTQVLYGILKVDDFYKKPLGGYKYYLVATDNQGLQAATDFIITIPESPIKYNHVINMTVNRMFDSSVPDVNEQLLINTKILESLGDADLNSINLISYEHMPSSNRAVFIWSNCSLTYRPCPTSELKGMFSKITDRNGQISESFKNSMLSQYTVYSIKTEKLAPCNVSEQVNTLMTSILISPSPSLPYSLPPILQTPLDHLNMTWCAPFVYQIPANTFNDANEGSTRKLSLEILHLNGSQLATDYWVKFDEETQTLLAYPTLNDVEEYEVTRFLITARNSRNLTATQVISMSVNTPKPKPNHQLLVKATAYVTKEMSDVDIRRIIYNKTKEYFKSTKSEVVAFANFTRIGQLPAYLLFTISYCSLTENACDRSGLDSMLKRVLTASGAFTSDFIFAFSPEVVIEGITVESLGQCSSAVATPSWIYSTTHEVLSSSIVVPARNQKPLVLQNIGVLQVESCKLFSYTVPEGLFYDIEDGLTRNLKVTVTTLNGTVLPDVSWIMFNSTTQTFTGVISSTDDEQLQYVLIATDKGGLSASQALQFQVQKNLDPLIFIVNTAVTSHFPAGTPRAAVLEYFTNKLGVYLSGKTQISVRILSFEESSNEKVNISWTICNVVDSCNVTFLSTLQMKLITEEGIVNTNVVTALRPNLLVNGLQVQNIQQCASRAPVSSMSSHDTIPISDLLVSTIAAPSSTTFLNNPPRFNKVVPVLHVPPCNSFSFQLPPDLCIDPEDGISGTKISITYENGTVLSKSSLLQFNSINNTVYGIIKQSDILPNGQLKSQFSVSCEDTKGLRTLRSLDLNVSSSFARENNGYSLTFQVYFYPISALPNVDIQVLWIKKLSKYLRHPSGSDVQFLNFKRISSIQAEFSIRFCFLDLCSYTDVNLIRDKIYSNVPYLNPDFISAMIPEFSLVSAGIQSPSYTICPTLSLRSLSPLPVLSSVPAIHTIPIAVLRSIPPINITLCSRFQYMIPWDTFYSKEDGYTSNLTVTLRYENNSAVDRSSWVQYDNSTLSISGYIVHEVAVTSDKFKFKLIAEDSRGSTASVVVTLKLLTRYRTVNHYYRTEAELHGSLESNSEIMVEAASKIKSYIGSEIDRGVFFVNFLRYDDQPPRIVFTWGSCALLESCDWRSLKAVSDRLLFSGSILNLNFVSALAPNIIVTKVTQSSTTNCSGVSTLEVLSNVTKMPSIMPSLVTTIILSSRPSFPEFTAEIIATTPASTVTTMSMTPAHPVVKNPLNQLLTAICSVLLYQLADNVFYDANDGYTRGLKVTARPQGESFIPENYWLQFDSESQTFIGQPTIEAAKRQPQNGYLFIVRATNKMSFFEESPLIIKIDKAYPDVNHNITLNLKEIGVPFLSTLDAISFIRNRTAFFFGDSTASNIGIIEYRRNLTISSSINITFYNCSVGSSSCNIFKIQNYLSVMVDENGNINNNFSKIFLPRFRLKHIATSISKNCFGSTSPLSVSLSRDVTNTRFKGPSFIQSIASTLASTEAQTTSKYSLSSAIRVNNSPPVALKSVNTSLPFCGSLRFTIPNDIFYDKEDGGLDRMNLRLLSVTGNTTDCNSTVKLNRTNNEIYGGAVLSTLHTPMNFLLIAQDKEGLAATTVVSFLTQELPQFTTFTVTFKVKPVGLKCIADVMENVHNALKRHLPFAKISILQYERVSNDGLQTITWTDCSLLDEKCNSNRSSAIAQRLIRNATVDKQLSLLIVRIGELQSVSMFSTRICNSPQQMHINITFCNSFKYVLNDSRFNSTVFNVQGQREERLAYQLTRVNGDSVPWARFDSKTNSITVIPVYNALKDRSTTELILNATYSNKTIKRIGITLFHHQSTAIQLNYSISMKIISYREATLSDIELLETIRERLLRFASSWLIIDHNRTEIYPQIIHVNMAPCFTITECNDSRKDLLTSEVSVGNGVPSYNATRAFLPDLILSQLSVTDKGTCYGNVEEKTKVPINITVSLCTELYSPVDGAMITSHVNNTGDDFELLDSNKKQIGLNSWVQFDKMNRVIYGLPTQQDLIDQPLYGYPFFLRVWKRTKTFEDIDVNVTITGNTAKPAYLQSIFYRSLPQVSQNKADILLDFRSKIARLLGNASVESIGLISFERGLDLSKTNKIEYTYCSLLQLPGICDHHNSSLLARQTILSNGQPSESLKMVLGKNYTLLKVIEEKSSVCGNSSNSSPRVINPLPELNVSACTRLEFPILNDTFIDREDGNVPSLLLSLKSANGTSLKATSWIQFDMYTKTIYGVPTYSDIQNKPISGYSLVLEAKDSQNGAASLPVKINLNANITERSLVSVIVNTSFPEWITNLEINRKFLQKTEQCLNISKQSVGIAYYGQPKETRTEVNISIFNNCSNFLESCDEVSAKEFFSLFVTNLTVKEVYQTCMSPEFSVIQVQMLLSRLCRNVTQNNLPIVNRVLPQLNISSCERLSYRVPNDTFFDVEDGLKILENVELRTRTGEPIEKSDFVQFDKYTRMIYALFPYDLTSEVGIFEYSLQVRDTEGKSISTKVLIQPERILHNFTYKVCVSLRKYSSAVQPDIDIIQGLLNRVEYFLTSRSPNGHLVVTTYSISSAYPQKIDVCFSNCSFVNGTCDRISVDKIRRKLFIRDSVPTLDFRQTLSPDFVMLKVSDMYSAYCAIDISQSTVLPTSAVPLTSSTIGTPIIHCLSGKNSAPVVLNSIGTLTAYVGQPKVYIIGSDVIYDKEDGYLRVSALTDMNGNEIQDTWIKYDKNRQRIYLSVIKSSMQGEKSFKIIGKDSCGTPVYDVIKIEILGVVSCCYTIRLTSYLNYSTFGRDVQLQNSIYKRLTEIYNDTSQYLRLYSIRRGYGNNTEVSFTNSSFTNESCYHKDTKQLSSVAFYENGTAQIEFTKQLSDFQIFDAVVNNSSWCNATLGIIPPVVVPPPGSASALTYQDWLWYILPFVILAFLTICCCLLYYWCTACRETCCGSTKADDLFTAAAAAKPIKEEEVFPQTDTTFQDWNPGVAAQAAPTVKPWNEHPDYYPDTIYADIGTTKNSSVPSMHRNKQLPLWMRQSASGPTPHDDTFTVSPAPEEEEPMIGAVTAMPQEATPGNAESPMTSNTGSQPKRKASELPLAASHIENLQHRPSYLISPSTSVPSFEEDPLTQSVAPTNQESQQLPERQLVDEDLINPVNRQNTQAALPMDVGMAPNISPALAATSEDPEQFFSQEPNSATGPALRLPSIPPLLSPGNPPPPYPSTKVDRILPKHSIYESQRKSSLLPGIGISKVRLKHWRGGSALPVENYEWNHLSQPRFSTVERLTGNYLHYSVPKERKSKTSFIKRTFSKPRGRRVDSTRTSYKRKEPVVIQRSPRSVRRYKVPSMSLRKSPSLGSYLTDSETDVTSIEEQIDHSGPEIRVYGRKDISDPSDDESQSPSEKEVPVEINGIVNAPESVLMNWMRDGTLKTTITNARPKSESKKKSRDVAMHKVKSPVMVKKGERKKKVRKDRSLALEQKEKREQSPSKSKRHTKQRYIDSPNLYIDDSSSGNDDHFSYEKAKERTLKRDYSHSRDPYEYVDTVTRPRRSVRKSLERNSRKATVTKSLGLENKQMTNEKLIFKKQRGKNKSERNIGEIFRRMSRRNELKRSREAFENEEFYKL